MHGIQTNDIYELYNFYNNNNNNNNTVKEADRIPPDKLTRNQKI